MLDEHYPAYIPENSYEHTGNLYENGYEQEWMNVEPSFYHADSPQLPHPSFMPDTHFHPFNVRVACVL